MPEDVIALIHAELLPLAAKHCGDVAAVGRYHVRRRLGRVERVHDVDQVVLAQMRVAMAGQRRPEALHDRAAHCFCPLLELLVLHERLPDSHEVGP